MKAFLMAAVAAASVALAGTAQAGGPEVAKEKGCMGCHDIDKKKMGPAFKDVEAKYKGKADAEAMLVAKVSGAKGHPKVKANEEEVKTVVHWVLTM